MGLPTVNSLRVEVPFFPNYIAEAMVREVEIQLRGLFPNENSSDYCDAFDKVIEEVERKVDEVTDKWAIKTQDSDFSIVLNLNLRTGELKLVPKPI